MPGSCSSPASHLCTVLSEKGPAVPTLPGKTLHTHPQRSPCPKTIKTIKAKPRTTPLRPYRKRAKDDKSEDRESKAEGVLCTSEFWAQLSFASGFSPRPQRLSTGLGHCRNQAIFSKCINDFLTATINCLSLGSSQAFP